MKLIALKKYFFSELIEHYPKTEVQSFFNLLIKSHLNISNVESALQPELKIPDSVFVELKKNILDLKKQVPIQYILGETEFYGLPFEVNKDVLIPRPETEELVQWIIDDLNRTKKKDKVNILDIGTGSGCIAISLAKKLLHSKVSAIDISEKALKTAEKNAFMNNVNVNFIEKDILKNTELNEKFDLIVSNPPYVRALEKKEMQKNVLNYEPHLALFVNDHNPLLFYQKIATFAKLHLNKKGSLYVEINQYLGKETMKMFENAGFENLEMKKDIFGNERMIKASI